MEFKQFFEASWNILGWNGSHWYEYDAFKEKPLFDVYIDKNRVSVSMAGPRHPQMKKALKILIKQRPDVADKELDFDGWRPGSVKEFLKTSEYHQSKDELPRFLYTGTSLLRWESIREDGLRPRSETGVEPAYGAQISSAIPANPDYIYLAGSLGSTVRIASRDAARGENPYQPVILRIDSRGLKYDKLRADEDSRCGKYDWQCSMSSLDTLAYKGKISPKYIELYKVYNPETKKYDDPGPGLEPQDWLAQQMLHRADYTEIPGVGRYKWVDPKSPQK